MMKAIRKEKRVLFKEMLYEKKFEQIKDGTYAGPIKVWNKKSKGAQKNVAIVKQDCVSSDSNKDDNSTKSVGTRPKSNENSNPNSDTIEGLDLNFSVDNSISDDDPDNDESAPMDFNGIPYKIVDTNVHKIEDMESDSEHSEEEK